MFNITKKIKIPRVSIETETERRKTLDKISIESIISSYWFHTFAKLPAIEMKRRERQRYDAKCEIERC